MKKFFTLLATAIVALSASAQNLWNNTAGYEVSWEKDGAPTVSAETLSAMSMKAGDKINVTISEKTGEDGNWPQVAVKDGNWGDLTSFGLWNYKTYPTTVSMTLTSDMIKTIQSVGFFLAGSGGKVTSIDFESVTLPTGMDLTDAIWMDLNATKIDNWSSVTIGNSAFKNMTHANNLQFRVLNLSSKTIVQLNIGGWNVLPQVSSDGARCVKDADKMTFTFSLTEEEIDTLISKGLVVQGVDADLYAVAVGIEDATKEVTKEYAGYEKAFTGAEKPTDWNCPGWNNPSNLLGGVYKTLVFEVSSDHEFQLSVQNFVSETDNKMLTYLISGSSTPVKVCIPVSETGIYSFSQYAVTNKYITQYYEPSMDKEGNMVDESEYGANTVNVSKVYLTNQVVESTYTPWVDPHAGIEEIVADSAASKKAVKVAKDGKIVIVKGNAQFNVAGQLVK